MTVLPLGIAPRKHFSAPAIGLAFALFGLLMLAPEEVRRRTNPWPIRGPSAGRWRSLFRWIDEVRDGSLFEAARASPPGFSAREVATRVAAALGALATTATAVPAPDLTFRGAAHMA